MYDAEAQAREKGRQRDREVDDLKRRLDEAETQANESQPELDAKQREIDVCVWEGCWGGWVCVYTNKHVYNNVIVVCIIFTNSAFVKSPQ